MTEQAIETTTEPETAVDELTRNLVETFSEFVRGPRRAELQALDAIDAFLLAQGIIVDAMRSTVEEERAKLKALAG